MKQQLFTSPSACLYVFMLSACKSNAEESGIKGNAPVITKSKTTSAIEGSWNLVWEKVNGKNPK